MAKYRLISSSNGELEVDPKTKEIRQVIGGSIRPENDIDYKDGLAVIHRDSVIVPYYGAEMFTGADPVFQDEIMKQTKGYSDKVLAMKVPGYEQWYKKHSPDGLRGEDIEEGEHLFNNPQYYKDVVTGDSSQEVARLSTGADLPEKYINEDIIAKPSENVSNTATGINPIIEPNTFLK